MRPYVIRALVALSFLLLAAPAEAGRRMGSLLRRLDPLTGSKESLRRQNEAADRFRLTRLRDAVELERFIASGLLVPIGANGHYVIDETLGEYDVSRRPLYAHARPWVKRFLDDVFVRTDDAPFRITSLVRTAEYQRRLNRRNPNGADGRSRWDRSPHLTGATVDVSYLGLSPETVRRVEKKLRSLKRAKLVIATRERHNACWHVMVFPTYARRFRSSVP